MSIIEGHLQPGERVAEEYVGNVPPHRQDEFTVSFASQQLRDNTLEAFRAMTPSGINEIHADNDGFILTRRQLNGSETFSLLSLEHRLNKVRIGDKMVEWHTHDAYSLIETPTRLLGEQHRFDRLRGYRPGAHEQASRPLDDKADIFPALIGREVVSRLITFSGSAPTGTSLNRASA